MAEEENEKKTNKVLEAIGASPVRYLAVAAIVAAGIVSVVNGYTPLKFDESLLNDAAAKTVDVGEPLDATKIATKSKDKEEEEVDLSGTTFATPKNGYKDGVYRGTGYGYKSYITVEVTIKGGKIVSCKVVSEGDDPEWFSQAKAVLQRVVNAQSTDVDTVSGATYSSKGILEAIANALRQAANDSSKTKSAVTKKIKKKTSKADSGLGDNVKLADGVYLGYDRCTEEDEFDYYLVVEVTIKNGKVVKISNVHGSGTGNEGSVNLGTYDTVNDPYLTWAVSGRTIGTTTYKGIVSQIMADAKKGTITDSVDVVSGATYSSKSILKAYFDALKKSAAAAGSSVETPAEDSPETPEGQPAEDTPETPVTPASNASFDASGTFTDGTFTSYAYCEDADNPSIFTPYYIGVTIAVSQSKVVEISDVFGDATGVANPLYRYNASENKYYLDRATQGYGISGKHPGVKLQINNALSAGEVGVHVDTISGATYSSLSIIEAFKSALEKARAAGTSGESSTTGGE